MPPSIEERVAYLEGRVGKVDDLGPRIDAVDGKLDRAVETLTANIDRVREELMIRIDTVDQKIDRVREELAARIDALDGKVDRMNDRMGVQFRWLVGIQVAVLVAVVGALLSP